MKLAVVFLVAFVFLGCQSQYYSSFNPRFMNPFFFSPWGSFNSAPMARHNVFNEPQYNAVNDQSSDQNYPLQESIGEYDNEEKVQPRFNSFNRASNNPVSPRFFVNPGMGYNNNGLLRTYLYTTIVTTTVVSLSQCIPAAQLVANANTCVRRKRREIAEILDRLVLSDDGEEKLHVNPVQPTPVEKVELTAVPLATATKDQSVSSSKEETHGKAQDADLKRDKRFFNFFGLTSTITSFSFVTSNVAKRVSVVGNPVVAECNLAEPIPNVRCLACIPPGYGVC